MGIENVYVVYDPTRPFNRFDLGFRKVATSIELSHYEIFEPSRLVQVVQGNVGAIGTQGPAGPAGAIGPAGPAGAIGAQGPAGPAGAIGAQGPVGPTGSAGATGSTGSKGDQGPAGLVGPQGPAGAAGAAGAQGPEGPAGIQGNQGVRGIDGEPGEDGRDGDPAATVWADLKAVKLIHYSAIAKVIPNWYPHTAEAQLTILNPSFPNATGVNLQTSDRNTAIELTAFDVSAGEQFARITLRVRIDPVADLWLEDTITVGYSLP